MWKIKHYVINNGDYLPEHNSNIKDKVGAKSKAFAFTHPESESYKKAQLPISGLKFLKKNKENETTEVSRS